MKIPQLSTRSVKTTPSAMRFRYSVLAFAMIGTFWPSPVLAQEEHSHSPAAEEHEQTSSEGYRAGLLLKKVREATERFKDVSVAEAEGYTLQFGCVSGDYSAAMGLHYVNGDLVNRGDLNVNRPQIVIYEPLPNGGRRLIGADYLLLADAWNANHSSPPQLMGQLFHLFEKPNRFGLPAFYTLHVWAWKENPQGAFVNWHPHVSCEHFAAQTP